LIQELLQRNKKDFKESIITIQEYERLLSCSSSYNLVQRHNKSVLLYPVILNTLGSRKKKNGGAKLLHTIP
jgi:hypothetical protein